LSTLKAIVHRASLWYIQKICVSEFHNQTFTFHNERSIEYRFALQALAEKPPKTVLDVGTGTTAWPHLLRNCGYVVTAIDNVRDYWPKGMVNRHWHILDGDISKESKGALGKYEAITCISVLEHIKDHIAAMRNMVALLEPGGLLILTTPFSYSNPDPNVYMRRDALYGKDLPNICRSSSSTELNQWLSCGLTLKQKELWKLFTGDVWATGERCKWLQAETEDQRHQLGCFLFVKTQSLTGG
jgi:hypothetical protein